MPRTLQSTRHFLVAQMLRAQIKTLPAGSVLPTLQELMTTHAASQTTIDRAMASLRREGLISRPAGKQRLVVNAVSDPALRRIAVIRPDYPSKVFDEVARAIVEKGRQSDTKFNLVYYRSMNNLDLDHATDGNDAAVLVATSEPYPAHLRAAVERPRKPLVLVQEIPPKLNVHGVQLDNDLLARIAVEHLVSLGHQRILFFNNEPPTYAVQARRDAWRTAMQDAGLPAPDDLICDCGTAYNEDSLEAAYRGFKRRLEEKPVVFTAIFIATTAMAGMAVMRALREHHISVPDDVSIVTYGGEEPLGAFTNPPLTTIELDMSTYGAKVIEMLDAQFQDPTAQRYQAHLAPTLVIRSSTMACPSSPKSSKRKGQS